ncbi:MAG: hypothetical protein KGJ13_05785, partial [Patescibacteria group bacterium]|nr:hypothetical protein [Patescibacteria group bacterium]
MKRFFFLFLFAPGVAFGQTKLLSGTVLPVPTASGGTGTTSLGQMILNICGDSTGKTSDVFTIKKGGGFDWEAGGSGMTNPMTTLGDIITGGSSGTPQRLAVGSNGQFLTPYPNGTPAWGNTLGF